MLLLWAMEKETMPPYFYFSQDLKNNLNIRQLGCSKFSEITHAYLLVFITVFWSISITLQRIMSSSPGEGRAERKGGTPSNTPTNPQ